ncbi:hypothetical protein [Acerihabitans arboris]|uniref:Uncharacterized protein n=1 Tax=Acerihabitans arboris TaxID=2691583 RepID=A0A845SLL9_9GAMM|nr:hypothetical protein [Acerihabitans arboris]NDL64889.1 hypothetical protein [Acerihabitans arboris]
MTDIYVDNSIVYLVNRSNNARCEHGHNKTGPSGFTRSFDRAANSTTKLVQSAFPIFTSLVAIAMFTHRLSAVSARGSTKLLNSNMPVCTTMAASHFQELSILIVGGVTVGYLVGCGLGKLKSLFNSEPVTIIDKYFYNYYLGVLVGVLLSAYITGLDETLA